MSRAPEHVPRPGREMEAPALIAALRARDERAIGEFMLRYRRLLANRAERAGVTPEDGEDCAMEVIEDVAEKLVSGALRAPPSLEAYIAGAFWKRYASLVREREREQGSYRDAIAQEADEAGDGEGIVGLACSEYTRAASRGPAWERPALSPVLDKLVATFEEGTTEEERLFLSWLSHFIPLRDIAVWLGINYATANQRSWRLRQRLHEAARRFAHALTFNEQRELDRFFRRASVVYDRPRARPAAARPPDEARPSREEARNASREQGDHHGDDRR